LPNRFALAPASVLIESYRPGTEVALDKRKYFIWLRSHRLTNPVRKFLNFFFSILENRKFNFSLSVLTDQQT